MKIPEEKELMELLDKTEKEQEIYLIDKELWIPIEKEPDKEYLCVRQACCLDNLAERLWEKAEKIPDDFLAEGIVIVCKKITGSREAYWADAKSWWVFYSPSHPVSVIIAALIAMKRSGVEI